MRTDILDRKDDILAWIAEERPKSYICQQLSCKPETLNSYLEKMGIVYTGQQNKKGQNKSNPYKPASYYLGTDKPIHSHKLKEKLFRDGLKQRECELCGKSEWMGEPIPLELHHKNGNHNDNSFDNLQILCPTCHAMQSNNSGKNIKKVQQPPKQEPKLKYCIDCGKEISKNATRCKSCAVKASERRKVKNRPDREELKNLIRMIPFTRIGERYGVSDNAIKKWCDSYNLPRTKQEISRYSDEEWEKL